MIAINGESGVELMALQADSLAARRDRWVSREVGIAGSVDSRRKGFESLPRGMRRIKLEQFEYEAVSILISPGDRPIDSANLEAHPELYGVYVVDEEPELVGYHDADEAERIAREKSREGKLIVVTSHYLAEPEEIE